MKKITNIVVSVIWGLAVISVAGAFSGPVTHPPAGNPTFWMKSGNDVYYNVVNGNVGVGTTGPGYKLDVQNGQINSSGGFCIAGNCKTDWNQIAGYWTLNGSSLYPNLTSYILGVGTTSLDPNYKITTSGGGIKAESTNQPAGYFSSASGYGLIVNSGYVGIGTVSPGYKLDVQNGQINASGGLCMADVCKTVWDTFTNYWTVSGNDIYNNNSGNVGIGTSNPGAKLEIAGQIKITGGSPGPNKVLTSDANGLATWQSATGGGIGGSGLANYLPKFVNDTTLGNSAIYDSGGSIGIGTAFPGATLDVMGNIRFGSGNRITLNMSSIGSSPTCSGDQFMRKWNAKNCTTGGSPCTDMPCTTGSGWGGAATPPECDYINKRVQGITTYCEWKTCQADSWSEAMCISH